MSNGLSWLERSGSLSWRNREILSQKIKQLGHNIGELKSNIADFLKFIEGLESKHQKLCEKQQRFAANDVVRLNKIQEKILLYTTLIQEAHEILQELGTFEVTRNKSCELT